MVDLRPVPVPDLSGRVVLVTGAGTGIGAELVRVLVRAGASVFAGVHGVAGTVVEELPAEAVVLDLDVTSQQQADAAIERVASQAGRLDALVNNAGVIEPIGHLATLASEALMPAFAVNVVGVHRMSVAALPLLRASQGVIVNAGTGAATTPLEGWTAYCSSKAGLHMLTRMLDLELAPEGIRTFFLGIPPTDTTMQASIRRTGLNPVSRIPRESLVPPGVPASVMAWLCGPQARGLAGIMLDVRQPPFTDLMAAHGG